MSALGDPFRPAATDLSPWQKAEHSFAGWIPNVSGHLSFSQVDPRGRQATFNNQAGVDEARTVVARRNRVVQDYPFWDWLVRLCRPAATQDFLLLAESGSAVTPYIDDSTLAEITDEQGALYGFLVVLPTDDDIAAQKRRKSLIKATDQVISAALTRRAEGTAAIGERIALDILTNINAVRSSVAAYVLRFALYRTGECRIWFDLEDFLGRNLTVEPASPKELLAADRLPAQAYYFLKDLLHAHYHHDASSDQILQLTRLSGRGAPLAQHKRDEIRWRYITLRGLVRVVVELRQGRLLQGHKRALGIIAYAAAFQSVLARALPTGKKSPVFAADGKLIPYEFDNLTRSIEATDSSMESVTTSRLQLFAIEIGILLSALALWAGAVQIQPILCGSKDISCPKIRPGPIISFVNVVVANPLGFTVGLLAIGFLFFIMFFRGTGAIPHAERFVRWVKSLADAIATQLSTLIRSDWIAWVLTLMLMASMVGLAAWTAYRLVPKTHVPPVRVKKPEPLAGPWSRLQTYVGKPVTSSGLLTNSIVAQDVRNLLGDDYYAHIHALQGATLKRTGDVFYALSSANAGDDAGYLILDTRTQRIEMALRHNGRMHPHRSPGGELPAPDEVRAFQGSSAGLDADPVPVEAPRCDLVQGGIGGRTIQLAGALRADAFCEYRIPLQASQSLTFEPKKAHGLYLSMVEGRQVTPIATIYTAQKDGRYVVRVGWSHGAGPAPANKARPFFMRLDIR